MGCFRLFFSLNLFFLNYDAVKFGKTLEFSLTKNVCSHIIENKRSLSRSTFNELWAATKWSGLVVLAATAFIKEAIKTGSRLFEIPKRKDVQYSSEYVRVG
jgi:hypothetical protein